MDFFNTLIKSGAEGIDAEPLIGGHNGLFIVVFLVVIYVCLDRIGPRKKPVVFSVFCQDCVHLKRRLVRRGHYCRQQCKYHPLHGASCYQSAYRKRTIY
ncbi:MAG: hypothetical protein K9K37_13475 [Desulfocapsa sp.]|nr:hypothetical protein [Desulfocapsa sp.]